MAPATVQPHNPNIENEQNGPHPSFIQVAKPYVFEQKLQECMAVTGVTAAKEDNIRIQGVAWIDSVRKALQLYGYWHPCVCTEDLTAPDQCGHIIRLLSTTTSSA